MELSQSFPFVSEPRKALNKNPFEYDDNERSLNQ